MKTVTLKEFLQIDKSTLSNKLIAFSTDTVFGVGVINDELVLDGINKIYQMKGRNHNKPISLLSSGLHNFIDKIIIHKNHQELLKLWPGALTIIFKKKDNSCYPFTTDTIGIRIPNSQIALEVLKHTGDMAVTSINLSGDKPINEVNEIKEQFSKFIDYLITDKEDASNISSTVVDATGAKIKILRQGSIIIK